MFRFSKIRLLPLKNSMGPWGPWSEDDDKKEQTQENKEQKEEEKQAQNSGDQKDNQPQDPKKDDKKEPEKDDKKDEVKKEDDQEEEENIPSPWQNQAVENEQKFGQIVQDLMSDTVKNKKKIGGGNSGSGGGSSGGDDGDFFDKLNKHPAKFGGLLIIGFVALWLATGFYKVDSDENAIVLYFGKFNHLSTPGLNYRIPYPIGKVIKQSITTVNSEEFGYSSSSLIRSNKNDTENLMLTGDENIVDIEFQAQWQIKDIEQFTFNISQPNLTIRKAAESAMREIIARTPISEALSDGKSKIEQETKDLLQQTLDSYDAGVRITLVQLRRVDPPKQVIDAFRDVQTAKADKEREINESQAYANDIIPRARGNAAEMQQKAEAYKSQVEADAQGEASRFLALFEQYRKAKEITRKRIYLETMQEVYHNIDKIIIDKNVAGGGSSVVPYFPLNDFSRMNGKKVEEGK